MSFHPETNPLPSFLEAELEHPPKSGDGVHRWIFRMVCCLMPYRAQDEIVAILGQALVECGRFVGESEIRAAIKSSKLSSELSDCFESASPSPTKWPTLDEEARSRIVRENPDAFQRLADESPIVLIEDKPIVNYFLHHLFEPGDRLCTGRHQYEALGRPLEVWMDVIFEKTCFIVPSPLSAEFGFSKEGKVSRRCLDNTGPRRYLVTEFDTGTRDEQAAIIEHLKSFAPLVMVLSSGGKSLHAWWTCATADEEQHLAFFRYAVALGADPATWTLCQYVRLPQGRRPETGARQSVYYFNPECSHRSMIEKSASPNGKRCWMSLPS